MLPLREFFGNDILFEVHVPCVTDGGVHFSDIWRETSVFGSQSLLGFLLVVEPIIERLLQSQPMVVFHDIDFWAIHSLLDLLTADSKILLHQIEDLSVVTVVDPGILHIHHPVVSEVIGTGLAIFLPPLCLVEVAGHVDCRDLASRDEHHTPAQQLGQHQLKLM